MISLGGGRRSTAMHWESCFCLCVTYIARGLNPDEAWITRKMVIIGYWLFRCWRCSRQVIASGVREGISGIRFMDGFIGFFMTRVYQQCYEESLYSTGINPSDRTYILEFLHSGIFARLFGIRVYHGNTVEHALHGELHIRWVTP